MHTMRIALLATVTILFLQTSLISYAEDSEIFDFIEQEFTFYPGTNVIESTKFHGNARIVLDYSDHLIKDISEYYKNKIDNSNWNIKEKIVQKGMLTYILEKDKVSGSIIIQDDANKHITLSIFRFSVLAE